MSASSIKIHPASTHVSCSFLEPGPHLRWVVQPFLPVRMACTDSRQVVSIVLTNGAVISDPNKALHKVFLVHLLDSAGR
jgi:hypothetical protein